MGRARGRAGAGGGDRGAGAAVATAAAAAAAGAQGPAPGYRCKGRPGGGGRPSHFGPGGGGKGTPLLSSGAVRVTGPNNGQKNGSLGAVFGAKICQHSRFWSGSWDPPGSPKTFRSMGRGHPPPEPRTHPPRIEPWPAVEGGGGHPRARGGEGWAGQKGILKDLLKNGPEGERHRTKLGSRDSCGTVRHAVACATGVAGAYIQSCHPMAELHR